MRGKRKSIAQSKRPQEPTSPIKSSGSGTAEDEDALLMYERIESLKENNSGFGQEVFGFRTPVKKNQMVERVAQELLARKGSPAKTPSKGSAYNSPLKETTAPCINTPQAFRKRVAKRLQRRPTEDEDSSSDSESSQEEDNDDDDQQGPISASPYSKPSSRAADPTNNVQHYFEAQDGPDKTSDRTLSRLKTPRLSTEALRTILSSQKVPYEKEIAQLGAHYRSRFPKWMTLLQEGFNLVCFGLGSKRDLLQDFMEEYICSHSDCVVVNGFFPSLTIKQVLNNISGDILEYSGPLASVPEHVEYILGELTEPLYLIVHNIDGPNLRGEKNQSVLAQLANHPLVHLVCSIDHINAPIIWDQKKLSKFNFICYQSCDKLWLGQYFSPVLALRRIMLWFLTWMCLVRASSTAEKFPKRYDSTTFLPYTQETLNENSLMVAESNALALSSLAAVFASLTPNAKSIFILIAEDQLTAAEAATDTVYAGISFPTLYQCCREAFLVNSDITLRAQLTEFKDHKLIRIKKGLDGMDHLTIPLHNSTLKDFIEDQKEA